MRDPFTNTSKLTTHPQKQINLLDISLLRIRLATANATTSQNYPAWMIALPQPKAGFVSAKAFAVLGRDGLYQSLDCQRDRITFQYASCFYRKP